MKVSQLLISVATAAIIAGNASAQLLTVTLGDKTSISGASNVGGVAVPTNNDLDSRLFIASEVNTTGAAGVGTLSGSITAPAADTWDVLGAARVTISVSGAVFNSPVAASSLVCPTGSGVSVFAGGNAGESSVTFLVNDIGACAGDVLNFNGINIAIGNGGVNVSASLERASTSAPIGVTRSTVGTSGDFVQRVSGIRIARDNLTTAVATTTAQLPGFSTLTPNTPSVNIRVGHALIATAATPAGEEVEVSKNVAGTPFADSDITGTTIPVVITVPSPTGLNVTTTSGATLGGAANFAASSVGGVLTYAVPKAGATAAGGLPLTFAIGPAAVAAPISAQTITAQGSVTLATSATPTQTTAFSQPAFNLLTITREGSSSTPVRWVGDGVTTSAISVFRLTGIPATVPVVRFTLSNATNGTSFNGEYVIPASAITRSAGGEVVLTSLTLQAVAGSFGRADVVITVEAAGTKIQRFVQAPNGTLAPAPEAAN